LADVTAPKPIAAPQSADKNESFFIVSPLRLDFRCGWKIELKCTFLVFILAMTKLGPYSIQRKIFYKHLVFGFLGLKNSAIARWTALFVYNTGYIA
jgi:hypothetical protein